MGIFDENKNLIEITQDDMHDAIYSSAKLDEDIKKRAFANVLGARLGIKFLKSIGINANNFESLYTIPAILKDMDISDVCVDNIRVDVRIVADENHLCVPKAHYEYDVTPDIYIFMKLSEDLSTAEFIGAIAPDEVNKSVENRDYYFISNGDLYNENSLKTAISKGKPKSNVQIAENEVIKAESMLVNFIDGDIMNHEKHYVYDVLKQSPELQNMFREFEKFENISTDLAHTDEILNDSVLDVLGAQQIYNEDLSEGEFASDVNLDELADETVADFVEDFIDDNKEENMLEDENDVIEGEFKELPDDDTTPVEEPGKLEELPTDEDLASFETTNNFENLDETTADDSFDFSEFTSNDETQQEESKGFEGFEGLGSNNSSEISFDDITKELSAPEISLDNIDVSSPDIMSDSQPQDTISLDRIQNLDDLDSQDETLDLSDFESIDSTTTEEPANLELDESTDLTLEPLEEIQPLEELTPEQNVQADNTFDEVDEVHVEDLSTVEEIEEEQPIEEQPTQMENLPSEEMNLSAEENFERIEAFEENPIDLTLPELGTDFGFEDLEDDTTSEENEPNDTQAQEDTTTTLDDIAQNVNFENIETDGIEVPELPQLEEIQPLEPLEDLSLDDTVQPVQLEENSSHEEPQEQEQEQQLDEHTEASAEKTDDEEDFSGLEEFTMDMASEVERQNPNLLKPQGPVNNYDASQGFGTQFDDFNPSNGFNPAPEFAEENLQQNSSNNDTEQQNDVPQNGGFEGFEGFENLDTSSQGDNSGSSEYENINLDDLDNFDDDETSNQDLAQSNDNQHIDNLNNELDNLINDSDYDFSELNLDDIDLNDPEIQNIDIELNNLENLDNLSSLDNIPAVDEQPQQYNETPVQNQEDFQNQYMQEQMGIPADNQQNYTPDFNANDQNTIETLYEDNTANTVPGDVMNQSFNQNQVNYTKSPKKQTKKKTSPLLGILLIVLVCAFAYTKKDMIIEKINENKGVTVSQDQNMPIEGETQEDKQDAELLNEAPNENSGENAEEVKQGIGAIPGEAGGPQDVASMNASLNQKGSMASQTPQSFNKTPEPLATSNVKRLYWEVPQELTYNASIVNFLKTAGKTIKFSMQSDLLNSTELPYSNKMIVNVVIKKDGSVDSITSTVSSGSKQIDSIVLQNVKAALKYVKAPTSEFKNDSYDFSLIINF